MPSTTPPLISIVLALLLTVSICTPAHPSEISNHITSLKKEITQQFRSDWFLLSRDDDGRWLIETDLQNSRQYLPLGVRLMAYSFDSSPYQASQPVLGKKVALFRTVEKLPGGYQLDIITTFDSNRPKAGDWLQTWPLVTPITIELDTSQVPVYRKWYTYVANELALELEATGSFEVQQLDVHSIESTAPQLLSGYVVKINGFERNDHLLTQAVLEFPDGQMHLWVSEIPKVTVFRHPFFGIVPSPNRLWPLYEKFVCTSNEFLYDFEISQQSDLNQLFILAIQSCGRLLKIDTLGEHTEKEIIWEKPCHDLFHRQHFHNLVHFKTSSDGEIYLLTGAKETAILECSGDFSCHVLAPEEMPALFREHGVVPWTRVGRQPDQFWVTRFEKGTYRFAGLLELVMPVNSRLTVNHKILLPERPVRIFASDRQESNATHLAVLEDGRGYLFNNMGQGQLLDQTFGDAGCFISLKSDRQRLLAASSYRPIGQGDKLRFFKIEGLNLTPLGRNLDYPGSILSLKAYDVDKNGNDEIFMLMRNNDGDSQLFMLSIK